MLALKFWKRYNLLGIEVSAIYTVYQVYRAEPMFPWLADAAIVRRS